MSKIDISTEAVDKQTGRSRTVPQQESAILRANMRYFSSSPGASANSRDCETAIKGALSRYFKVDIAQ